MEALAPSPAAGGACCDHQHSHAHHDHDDVDVINDPTLMSCCEKDQVAYDRAMALKSLLTAHDPTTQNVRMRQQVVAPPPPQAAPVTTTKAAQVQVAATAQAIADKLRTMEVHSDEDDDDSDLDLDEDFDALFAARRQELAAQFQVAAKNAADGYGIILETDLQALLKELTVQPEVPRVAFVRPGGLDASVARDMHMQMLSLASRFLGTKFYSVMSNASSDDEALRQLRLSTAPTIVAFRRGQRVDATAIQEKELAATSATILWEARLVPWLTMCNVLETTRAQPDGPKGLLSRSTSLKRGDTTDADAEAEVGAFDCGVTGCRIRFAYEHEHVGPSQEAKAEISAWRTSPSTPA